MVIVMVGIGAICVTGGTALTAVIGMLGGTVAVGSAMVTVGTLISGIAATAFGVSDLSEAGQDLYYGFQGSDEAAINLIRDTLFFGNENTYYDIEMLVTGGAAAGTYVFQSYDLGGQIKAAGSPNYGNGNVGISESGRNGGTRDVIELSKSNIQHIKKHTFDGMAEQAKYLTDEQLANKLENTTFFNKNWPQDEVVKYTQEAYNTFISQEKTGLQSMEINGEIVNVFIKDDGTFDTAYGVHKFTVDDFR